MRIGTPAGFGTAILGGTSTEIEVEFVTDEAGVVTKVLHQNGQETRAPKRKPDG